MQEQADRDLDNEDPKIRRATLKMLRHRAELWPGTLRKVASLICDDSGSDIRREAVRILNPQKIALGEITDLLSNKNPEVRAEAIWLLEQRDGLSQEILDKVAELLYDDYSDVVIAAMSMVTDEAEWSAERLSQISDLLHHKDSAVSVATAEMLGYRKELPLKAQSMLVDLLSKDYWDARQAAETALKRQQALLTVETLSRMVDLLSNDNQEFRRAATSALQHLREERGQLPAEILSKVQAILSGNNAMYAKEAAMEVLGFPQKGPMKLSMEALRKTVDFVSGDHDNDIKEAAMELLEGQEELPAELIDKLAALLSGHDDYDIVWTALEALESEAELPHQTISKIASLLDNKDPIIRRIAIRTLDRQAELPSETLEGIADRLGGGDYNFQVLVVEALNRPREAKLSVKTLSKIADSLKTKHCQWATKILQHRTKLPAEVRSKLVDLLSGDHDRHVKRSAMKVLRCQVESRAELVGEVISRMHVVALQNLINLQIIEWSCKMLDQQVDTLPGISLEMLSKIPDFLAHENPDLREVAVDILGYGSEVPLEMVGRMAELLSDVGGGVRAAVIRVLNRQAELSPQTLGKVAALLNHKKSNSKSTAIRILSRQLKLPTEALINIAAYLGHGGYSYMKHEAEKILGRHIDLPIEVLAEVATCLHWKEAGRRCLDVLLAHDELPPNLLDRVVQPFCQQLARRAFEDHLICWIEEGRCFVATESHQTCLNISPQLLREALARLKDQGPEAGEDQEYCDGGSG